MQLRIGIYYVFIKEWLKVFPRQNFKFIRLEDYKSNEAQVLTDTIRFLGLGESNSTRNLPDKNLSYTFRVFFHMQKRATFHN